LAARISEFCHPVLGNAAKVLIEKAQELQNRDSDSAGAKGWKAGRDRRGLKTEYNKIKREAIMLGVEFDCDDHYEDMINQSSDSER